MSKYTTGEIAKLCGVTVRTVQYYDSRNLLVPSALSEGGRRLYSDQDLQRLKVICFLRDLDLPINTISDLLSDNHPEDVIDLLLQQQAAALRSEIVQQKQKLEKLEQLQREVRLAENFSVETIGDIAYIMEYRKKLRKVRSIMLGVGISLEIVEWGTLILAIRTGIWRPFLMSLCAVIGGSIWMSIYYYRHVKYICPRCHTVFRPDFWQMFWANHTPNTRKLICTSCGTKGFCVETYGEEMG